MRNISKENEFSPNKLLNGSEIQFYKNIKNLNSISTSQEYKSTIPTQNNTDINKPKKNITKLIRPELDFLKITKIKLKTIKELITTKFDKAFKELNNNINNINNILLFNQLNFMQNPNIFINTNNVKYHSPQLNDLQNQNPQLFPQMNIMFNNSTNMLININNIHKDNKSNKTENKVKVEKE